MSDPIEFDGLVVEGANGVRLLALPTAVLRILENAEVIQFQRHGRVSRMRVGNFLDGRDQSIPQPAIPAQQPADELHLEPLPSRSAPTPEYGAPDLGLGPSPTPPPASEADLEDPANIPLRARRGGQWVNIYVTRAQYEQYKAEGRIAAQAPQGPEGVRGVDGATEGA